jgi:pyruvyltransferase
MGFLFNKNNNNAFWVSWDAHRDNFGDILTPYIVEYFTDKKINRISSKLFPYYNHFFVIGSILQKSRKTTIVWGSGFISSEAHCAQTPQKVYAVRGPKTREKLLKEGIECPEVYGDPALLMPEIYQPKQAVKKTYKLGIIPHYVDKKHPWLEQFKENQNIKVIDVQQKNPLNVIDDMLSCEKVISSSLHGIIVADAYRIPSLWISFSDKVLGEGFKFQDYFLSVARAEKKPHVIKNTTSVEELLNSFEEYAISIDLEKLKAACPFK